MSLFENDEYDVLKFNVISNDLAKLNKLMKGNFEYTSNYPNYIPHLTIAYLKKGEGKKYIKNMETLEIENINNFIYSDKDYKETKL
jgi:2'-5' RNA ligase